MRESGGNGPLPLPNAEGGCVPLAGLFPEKILAGQNESESSLPGCARLSKRSTDWSERHDHLAGALGAAIAARLFERGWLLRTPGSRAVRLTGEGRAGLQGEPKLTLA
jgi:hypothetical protein